MSWYTSLAGVLTFIVAGPSHSSNRPQADDSLGSPRNVPIPDFQNPNDTKSYDFDTTPQGLFLSIRFAEGFEYEIGNRRFNGIVPVNPTESISHRFVRLYDLQTAPASGIVPGVRPVLCRGDDRSRPRGRFSCRLRCPIAFEDETGYFIGFVRGYFETTDAIGGREDSRQVARQMRSVSMGAIRFTVRPVDEPVRLRDVTDTIEAFVSEDPWMNQADRLVAEKEECGLKPETPPFGRRR